MCIYMYVYVCNLINLWLLDSHCCASIFLVVASENYSVVVACRLLVALASLVVENGL